MIVESMSYEDLCREFDKIHREFFPRIQKRMERDGAECAKIRRFMLKHKSWQNVLFPAITYQVDNNTTFCAIPHIHDYSTFKKIGPTCVTFITYVDKHGMNALVRGGDFDNKYFIITSHFFDRYMQRFLNTQISKIDAIAEFFANNGCALMTPHPTAKQPNNMIGTANDIVFFGEKLTDTIAIMKTCITREQLFDDQTHSTEMLDVIMQEFDVEREKLKQFIVQNRNNPYSHASFF